MSEMKKAIDLWVKTNVKLDVAQVRASTGLRGTPLLDKYKGEEKGEGWRQGQTEEGRPRKTDYFDEKRKKDSEVSYNAKGQAMSGGFALNDKRGYVVDPETGKLHQFKEGDRIEGNDYLSTHHSSPLGGKDVAGAGEIKAEYGKITEINDRSGHYRPDGTITFQAVRQINLANMAQDIQERLKQQGSTMKWTKSSSERRERQGALGKDGLNKQTAIRQGLDGTAEAPDTLEQLIAAEIGKKRDAFFATLDAAQAKEIEWAYAIQDKDAREKQIAAVNAERQALANEFRKIAKSVEDELRDKTSGKSPLLVEEFKNPFPSGATADLVKLSEQLKAIEEQIVTKRTSGEDTSKLELAARKLRQHLDQNNHDVATSAEAKVTLLGKTGMLSDQEYKDTGKDKDKINTLSALKQLVAPLGEAEFGKLVKQGKGAVETAMKQLGATSVAELKAKLGQKIVDGVGQDPIKIAELAKAHGIKPIDQKFDLGAEMANFEIGQANATTLTAQQFLQTGGNEAQIQNKQALNEALKQAPSLKHVEEPKPSPDAPKLGKVLDTAKPGLKSEASTQREAQELEISKRRRKTIEEILHDLGSDVGAKRKMLEAELNILVQEKKNADMDSDYHRSYINTGDKSADRKQQFDEAETKSKEAARKMHEIREALANLAS